MDEIVGTQKKFNDLSAEEFTMLKNIPIKQLSLIKTLEFIFSFVGYDEEGYLAKHYNNDDSVGYIMGDSKEVYEFFANKRKQEILDEHLNKIDARIKLLSNKNDQLLFLKAYSKFIKGEVNSNPLILYGFTQTELMGDIEYPYFHAGFIKNDQFYQVQFRGALLKGEGAAYSYIKNAITRKIEPLKENINKKVEAKKEALRQINEANKENLARKTAKGSSSSIIFRNFIKNSDAELYQILLNNFTGAKPQRIASMLFALDEENFLQPGWSENQTKLHSALTVSFGTFGSRQALNQNINDLGKTKVAFKKQQIKDIKIQLAKELSSH